MEHHGLEAVQQLELMKDGISKETQEITLIMFKVLLICTIIGDIHHQTHYI
jgi:hypothetical protein